MARTVGLDSIKHHNMATHHKGSGLGKSTSQFINGTRTSLDKGTTSAIKSGETVEEKGSTEGRKVKMSGEAGREEGREGNMLCALVT